ncbi:MAG: CBS domain-containing protein [Planctomycetes bacterium]|nr:CBS domain-containing protein [Planctomycetota bacterium]
MARFFRVPLVTGYILAGVLIGPPVLGWITEESVLSLNIVSQIALDAIMFMIGTEFESNHFRRVGKKILTIAGYDAAITFLFVGVATVVAGIFTLTSLSVPDRIRLGLLLGSLAIATAPAATLLVLKEYDSEGPVTENILALVVLNNVICLVFFYVIFAVTGVAESMTIGGAALRLVYKIFGSIIAGIVIGLGVSYLDRKIVGKEQVVVTVGGILLTVGICNVLPLSAMLASLSFGVIFVNAAVDPQKVTDEVYRTTIPLYVAFFVLAGAELHLSALRVVGVVGICYVVARSLAKWVGINIGCRSAASPRAVQRFLGIGMLCQAGVVIGLVSVAAREGGAIGELAQNTILGSVVIFEMIGPLLVKLSVVKAGEVKLVNLLHREGGEHEGSDIVAIFTDLLVAVGYQPKRGLADVSELRVKHVMRRSVKPILENMRFDDVVRFVDHSRSSHFPVVDKDGRFKGVISMEELRNVLFDEILSSIIIASDLAREDVPLLFPEDTLRHALSKFQECGFSCLPVVDSRDPGRLVGLLDQRSVLRFYHEQTQQRLDA